LLTAFAVLIKNVKTGTGRLGFVVFGLACLIAYLLISDVAGDLKISVTFAFTMS
jgi:hypothetical protein